MVEKEGFRIIRIADRSTLTYYGNEIVAEFQSPLQAISFGKAFGIPMFFFNPVNDQLETEPEA